ncbi:MAG: hypothetical protein LC096_04600 [Bacteroidia bacterium]|nr:hypothetical protein [Bacteroidia bacterium]
MQQAAQLKDERYSKIWGYTGSFLLHAALFIFMWLLAITPPDPPYSDTGGGGEGLTMAFGEPDAGGLSEVPVESPTIQEQNQEPLPEPQQEAPVITDETDEEPIVTTPVKPEVKQEKKEVKKPVEKTVVKTETKPVEKPREVDQRSVFKKKTGGNSDGYGDGEAPGNKGSEDGIPGGDPNGNGYGDGGSGGSGGGIGGGNGTGIGTGTGSGISFDLKGRSIAKRPNIEDQSKETGKVVVSIVVDRTGKVTKAMPNQRGTTTLSAVLLEKAKQAALETRFTPNPGGPEEQFGTITITFKFRP